MKFDYNICRLFNVFDQIDRQGYTNKKENITIEEMYFVEYCIKFMLKGEPLVNVSVRDNLIVGTILTLYDAFVKGLYSIDLDSLEVNITKEENNLFPLNYFTDGTYFMEYKDRLTEKQLKNWKDLSYNLSSYEICVIN